MSAFKNDITLPSSWTPQGDKEVKLVRLGETSSEFKNIKEILTGESYLHLSHIMRVENPYIYGRYLLRKLEYAQTKKIFEEKRLFHATAASNVQSIISNNLDWRKVRRARFGKGVSFSPDAVYANKECSKKINSDRAMLIMKVLVSEIQVGGYGTVLPAKNYNTTGDKRGNVLVKYYDDEFYPEYVAYYTNTISIKPKSTPSTKQQLSTALNNSSLYDDSTSSDD